MTNLSIYKNKSNTVLLNELRKIITKIQKKIKITITKGEDAKIRSLIKELKTRTFSKKLTENLTEYEMARFHRLLTRFTWI